MKILQTNKAYYPKVGGIETTITTLSEGLVKDYNLSVNVLVCNSKPSSKTTEKLINNVNVKYLANYGSITSLPISPGYIKSLLSQSGDILHIHEPFPWADLSLILFPRIRKNFSKIVVSWHSDIVRQKWVLFFYGKYIHKFLQIADKIIVSNPALIVNSDFLPMYKEKCEVIPIGPNLNWVNSNFESNEIYRKIKSENNIPMVLFVGRLVYYKGIQYLIDAMNLVADTSLVIIGSGPLKNQLSKRIKDLGLNSRIKIIPEVDEKKLHSYYKACDLLVLPSILKSETYGIVQIEAMACGKPVVCTNLGTGTDFINQDGQTGIVVPPRNSKALADAIAKLLKDTELRSMLGNKARDRVLSEFNSNKMVQRTFEVYKNLLIDENKQ